ncbi:uncharacterized protein LOC132735178 isoform X1 [Ruditapes philippinarum]|uniref:uncharacterized protein LOC132735178 isoform X1 n=1 Tax=Ruditapes philippinarum TaxID=129788 RepID=UPI00295BF71F|nr:uncharacterized protein LOC132735178 isoform X1 [Ruditapes philippinarum]
MREKGRLSCARCSASFPNVSILKCDNTILGITLTMCKTCHKRFHPTCTSHISATRPGDRMCDRCLHCQATLVSFNAHNSANLATFRYTMAYGNPTWITCARCRVKYRKKETCPSSG